MPRKSTGSFESHDWKDGRTTSWRLRVTFKGGRYRIELGTNHEGWNEDRARVELEKILGEIERGTWTPPEPEPESPPEEVADETIHVTASRFWQKKKVEPLSENTKADLRWRADFLLAFRPDTPTSSIDARWVDEFREWLLKRPAKNRKNGETLSARSANMALEFLAQVLDLAIDHKIFKEANPARGKRQRVKEKKSKGSFLEPDMVIDLIEEAGKWEAKLAPHQRYGRRSLVAALVLCGPRIGEALAADEGDFDLAQGGWRIPDSKTAAGIRHVEIPAFACEEIRTYVATKKSLGRASGSRGPMWVTRKGTRLSGNNVRRMMRTLVKRVNKKREKEGKMLLPKVTPHTLRRTYACLSFWVGRELPWVMDQIGHDDSRMTVGVYGQATKRRRVDRDLAWRLMRFADEPVKWQGGQRP
jgi:integrase